MARGYGHNLYEDEDGKIRPRVPQVIDARAPMADLSANKPMTTAAPATLTTPSVTPAGIWNQMFQPRGLGGMTNASPSVTTPQPAVSAFGSGLQQTQTPSLSTLAAGGMNHAQKWTAPPTATPPASLNQFSTTPADATAIARQYAPKSEQPTPAYDWKKSFSWASSFNR